MLEIPIMILVEKDNVAQQRFCINTILMYEDMPVEKVDIKLLRPGVYITTTQVLNQDLVPYSVKNCRKDTLQWLTERGFFMNTHRQIFFTELALTQENRDPHMPVILSLATNATSLIDKYWLNPVETTEFTVNGAHILFEKKTWGEVDPFRNLYYPGQLEEYALNDIFAGVRYSGIPAKSLVWSTSGAQNKRWMLDEDKYYLEKKLTKEDFNDEISTFEFFANTNVLIPKYECHVRELDYENYEDFHSFCLSTIGEGLFIIKKRCLTDTNSFLVPLCDYMSSSKEIKTAIQTMCEQYKLSKAETIAFIELIEQYQKQFTVPDYLLNTQNIGLFVSKQKVRPVVWGRLKWQMDWTGCIMESPHYV